MGVLEPPVAIGDDEDVPIQAVEEDKRRNRRATEDALEITVDEFMVDAIALLCFARQ